jgi:hypothetical protein
MDREFGIAPALAQHLEYLFECAPKNVATELAVYLVEAIEPGIDPSQLMQRAKELELDGASRTEDKLWAFLLAAQEASQAHASPIPKPSFQRKLAFTIDA